MDLFTGILMIVIVIFVIFLILVYQWLDKHRFSVERNFVKNKETFKYWDSYVSEVFKDDEKMIPLIQKVTNEKKIVRKINAFNEFQENLNRYCEGDDAASAEYKKIRKRSYDILKEFANVHNVLAVEYNDKLEKNIAQPVVKILRLKEMPRIYLGTEVPFYRR